MTPAANAALAAKAAARAAIHPPGTAHRRAASALATALMTTRTIEAAKRALPGFTDPATTAAALELLGQLTKGTPDDCSAPGASDAVTTDPKSRTRARRPHGT